MNLLADESVDRQIVDRLRQEGHTVRYVAEMEPGIPDDIVLNLASQEADVLLTADKDFGELVFRQGRLTSGILFGWRACRQSARQRLWLLPSISMVENYQAPSLCSRQDLSASAGWSEMMANGTTISTWCLPDSSLPGITA